MLSLPPAERADQWPDVTPWLLFVGIAKLEVVGEVGDCCVIEVVEVAIRLERFDIAKTEASGIEEIRTEAIHANAGEGCRWRKVREMGHELGHVVIGDLRLAREAPEEIP